jgi:hypothetical protein
MSSLSSVIWLTVIVFLPSITVYTVLKVRKHFKKDDK